MAVTDLFPSSISDAASAAAASKFNPINMVTSGRGYLDTLANKFILKPANAKGLAGFVFDYEGDTTVHQASEITDHYSEQNTFSNDHVAQKPARIVLRGYVAELAVNPSNGVLGVLATLQGKLTTLPSLLGKYTPAVIPKIANLTTQATNYVNRIDSYIGRAQNIVGLLVGSAVASTKQEKAYQQLYALWANNTVFTLTTPFTYFRSVMIESMTFTQDETTKQWSEISVTVKEVRFAGTAVQGPGLSPQLAAQNAMGRSQFQIQNPINNGKVQGTVTSVSKVFGGF